MNPTTNYYKATKYDADGHSTDIYLFFYGDLVGSRAAYDALLKAANRKGWPTDKVSVFRAVAGVPIYVPEIGLMPPTAERFAISGGE